MPLRANFRIPLVAIAYQAGRNRQNPKDMSCWQVVLMGDAAHSMSPTLGQACNCGLEDAKIFAGKLVAYMLFSVKCPCSECAARGPRCRCTCLQGQQRALAAILVDLHLHIESGLCCRHPGGFQGQC